MPVLEEEVDFPRGKPVRVEQTLSAKSSAVKRKLEDDDQLFGTGDSKKSISKKKKAKSASKPKPLDGLWTQNISYDNLTEGVMGMAVVKEIHEDHLILETIDTCYLKLPATQIGKLFTKLLKEDKVSLEQAFVLGQMVPFKIITEFKKNAAKKGITYPIITCDPAKLNGHLIPARLVPGLVIHGIVESIEEKGAVLDIGLSASKGFLPKEKQSAKGIYVGQPVVVRIESQASRIVRVTSFVEQDNLCDDACEKLQLNHLMPGTVVECTPTEHDPTAKGVIVSLGNGVNAFLFRKNLPPRLRGDTSRFIKPIRCVVMVCVQNSNYLILSAHPDIVAVSKPEKRVDFCGLSEGDVITAKVMDVNPKVPCVSFNLPAGDDGKTPLVTAFSFKHLLHKADEVDSIYKIGSDHQCRVMDICYADRCVVVTTRKDFMKQKIVSYKELSIGQVMDAKVLGLSDQGVSVMLCGRVRAYMRAEMASDKKLALDKTFPVDKEFKCRILEVDDEKKQALVTARPSLLNHKGTIIQSYDEELVGQTSIGVVVHVLPKSYLVSFFNNVKGLLPLAQGPHIKLRQVVEVRVTKVIPSESCMMLTLADQEAIKKNNVMKLEVSPLPAKVYSGTVEDVRIANVGGKRTETITLSIKHKGEDHEVSLSSINVSDAVDQPFETLDGAVKKGTKITGLVPLGTYLGANRVAYKGLANNWIQTGKNVPTTVAELKEGELVCAIVVQKLEFGVFVELIGGGGLVGRLIHVKEKKNKIDEDESEEMGLILGQTIVARIEHVNNDQTFTLTKLPEKCFTNQNNLGELALALSRSYVEEMNWLCSLNEDLPTIGSTVDAEITHIVDETAFVKFGKDIIGHIKKGNYQESAKKGDKVKCLVLDYVFPRKDAELVAIAGKAKKAKADSNTAYKVVQVKRDYFVILNGNSLYFVANRLHPNIVPVSKKGRVSLGDSVEISSSEELFGNVRYGLFDNDDSILQALSKGSLSGSNKKSVKNFGIYTATVSGPWDVSTKQKHQLSVKLELPGDNIGRLHISEFSKKFIADSKNEKENMLSSFIKNNLSKTINIKVIGFTTIKGDKKIRVAECTMNEDKIAQSKLKGKSMQYKPQFKKGDCVKAFSTGKCNKTGVCFEINPFTNASIARSSLPEEFFVRKETSDTGAVVDLEVPQGIVLDAIVVNFKTKHTMKHLELKLRSNIDAVKEYALGQKFIGRVVEHSKNLGVFFILENNTRALLTATSITDKYEKLHQYLSTFQPNEMFNLHAFRSESSPKRYYVVTEARYSNYINSDKENSKKDRFLLENISAVKEFVGKTLDGIIVNQTAQLTYVEIGPGLTGSIKKADNAQFAHSPNGTVVSVTVKNVTEKGIIFLKFKNILYTPSIKDVKQKSEAGKEDKKEKEKEKNTKVPEEVVKIEDPGFDFSNSGFKPEDLAVVGKLDEDEDKDSKQSSIVTPAKAKDNKAKKEKTPKSKTERDLQSEINLIQAENAIAEEDAPKTDDDFNRLIRKDPNLAEPWIKYMTFFLEKNDLTKARATAERALSSIFYREEVEIFNMWTAYLNMEVAFGDMATAKSIFEKACQNADSLKMHKQMALILGKNGKIEEADEIYDVMIKKFRASSDEVWTLYATHLMHTERVQKGRDLLQRALSSVPKARHSDLITKFAQLEFKKGDAERGRTLFESLLTAYPKKTDLVIVYADIVVKHSGIEDARTILDRACNLPLNMHKLRPLFKKWMELEEKYGDEKSQQLVRSKAEKCVKDIVEDME